MTLVCHKQQKGGDTEVVDFKLLFEVDSAGCMNKSDHSETQPQASHYPRMHYIVSKNIMDESTARATNLHKHNKSILSHPAYVVIIKPRRRSL